VDVDLVLGHSGVGADFREFPETFGLQETRLDHAVADGCGGFLQGCRFVVLAVVDGLAGGAFDPGAAF